VSAPGALLFNKEAQSMQLMQPTPLKSSNQPENQTEAYVHRHYEEHMDRQSPIDGHWIEAKSIFSHSSNSSQLHSMPSQTCQSNHTPKCYKDTTTFKQTSFFCYSKFPDLVKLTSISKHQISESRHCIQSKHSCRVNSRQHSEFRYCIQDKLVFQ
jgi:hypothetical protein